MDIQFWESAGGRSDVYEFLIAQPINAQQKFDFLFNQLDTRGMLKMCQAEIVKKIKPDKNLYELRYSGNKLAYRYLFSSINGSYWVLCGFIKKSQRTPKRKLETARRRYKLLISN